MSYTWTDNPTEAGVAVANTDVLNDNLMYLRYAKDIVTVTCSTAGATSTKEITIPNADFTKDFMFFTKFANANTARPQCGTDLQVTFSDGTANDDFGLYNVTTIGSPTYTGNKFNSNGTTGLSYPITTLGSGTWCVQGKFKSTNTSTQQVLFRSGGGNFRFALLKTTANKLGLYLSSNNSSWDIANGTLSAKADWSTSVEYYIRVYFTGTAYKVDWSTDGTTWTNEITVNSTSIVYPIGALNFGIDYDNSGFPLIGTMDDLYVTVGSSTIIQATELSLKANGGTAYPIYDLKGNFVKSSMFTNSANESALFKWDSVNTRYVLIAADFWVTAIQAPSSTYEATGFTDTTTTQTYTVPADGYVFIFIAKTTGGGTVIIYRNGGGYFSHVGYSAFGHTQFSAVKKGDILSKTQDTTGFAVDCKFYYSEGSI